jgi:hypothetical protein
LVRKIRQNLELHGGFPQKSTQENGRDNLTRNAELGGKFNAKNEVKVTSVETEIVLNLFNNVSVCGLFRRRVRILSAPKLSHPEVQTDQELRTPRWTQCKGHSVNNPTDCAANCAQS